MGFGKEIRAAVAAGRLVRVEREAIETGWLTGYVVAAGPSYFAPEIVDGSIRLNGVACMRYLDVTSVIPEPHSAFIERALAARGAARAKQVPVDLKSLASIIAGAGKAFPIFTVHVPHPDGQGYDCYIGRLVAVDAATVQLYHITPDAEWERELTEIPLTDINRVDFGGDYEEALFLAAR